MYDQHESVLSFSILSSFQDLKESYEDISDGLSVSLFYSRSEWQVKQINWIFHFSKHFWPLGTLEKVKILQHVFPPATGSKLIFKKVVPSPMRQSDMIKNINSKAVFSAIARFSLGKLILMPITPKSILTRLTLGIKLSLT